MVENIVNIRERAVLVVFSLNARIWGIINFMVMTLGSVRVRDIAAILNIRALRPRKRTAGSDGVSRERQTIVITTCDGHESGVSRPLSEIR
jgi:hypothetical protein